MNIRDEFESWFKLSSQNDNIDFTTKTEDGEYFCRDQEICFIAYCASAASKQSEIDELKGAIREFLNIENKYDECDSLKSVIDWQSLHGKSIENLRNLLEQAK